MKRLSKDFKIISLLILFIVIIVYSTTIMVPAMVGKSMVMRPQITHHSAQYILHVKLDDGRILKINTFKLAYETVEIGKRYKYKDL